MFKKDDFLNSSIPYENIYKEKDPIEHERIFKAIEENARAVGVRNFEHLYRCYVVSLN